jgi:hypothetical protein
MQQTSALQETTEESGSDGTWQHSPCRVDAVSVHKTFETTETAVRVLENVSVVFDQPVLPACSGPADAENRPY